MISLDYALVDIKVLCNAKLLFDFRLANAIFLFEKDSCCD